MKHMKLPRELMVPISSSNTSDIEHSVNIKFPEQAFRAQESLNSRFTSLSQNSRSFVLNIISNSNQEPTNEYELSCIFNKVVGQFFDITT
jgi:hypothetical protein